MIKDNHPQFLSVNDLVVSSAEQTRDLLRQELEIRLGELQEKWHFASLEKNLYREKNLSGYRKGRNLGGGDFSGG